MAEEVKSYHQLRQEEKKASKPQPSGGDYPKPAPGSMEYELKGMNWNIKGLLKEMQELNASVHTVIGQLDDIRKKMNE